MAFTQSDLDAVDRAIASGQLTVRNAAGAMVTYRDTASLIAARDTIRAALSEQAATAAGRRRAYPRHQLASFSDDRP